MKNFAINRGGNPQKLIAPCGGNTLKNNPHVRGFRVFPKAGPDEPVLEWVTKDYNLYPAEFVAALLTAAKEIQLDLDQHGLDPNLEIVRIFKDWIGSPPAMEFIFGEAGRIYMTCVRKFHPRKPVLRKDLAAWLEFARRFTEWRGGSTPFKDPHPFWDRYDHKFLENERIQKKLMEAAQGGKVLVQHSKPRGAGGMRQYWVTDLAGAEFKNTFDSFIKVLVIIAKHRLEGKWEASAGQYFNRDRGAPWSVTGDGKGRAEGKISYFPNECPSYGKGPDTWVLVAQDEKISILESPTEGMCNQTFLKELGIDVSVHAPLDK